MKTNNTDQPSRPKSVLPLGVPGWAWAIGALALAGAGWFATSAPDKRRAAADRKPAEVAESVARAADPAAPSATAPITKAPGATPEGMVWIPGGTFWMGSDDPTTTDALPVHRVTLDGYWIDRTEVTNRQFARFVSETGYITVAEMKPDAKDFPGAPPENLVPGSLVFSPPAGKADLDQPYSWWQYVPGASWKHPAGPESNIDGKDDHPVVHVCWDDALAYARWAKKRLPTEAEWEYAARGGLDRKRYTWGDEQLPNGRWQVNNWQGPFPSKNELSDGFAATAPVGTFAANGFGLADMAGNVWEWCADWYRPNYDAKEDWNPRGPGSSYDPYEPDTPKRVQRGGSFLCSDTYCTRYLPGARGKGAVDSGTSHAGFRCVVPGNRAPRSGT